MGPVTSLRASQYTSIREEKYQGNDTWDGRWETAQHIRSQGLEDREILGGSRCDQGSLHVDITREGLEPQILNALHILRRFGLVVLNDGLEKHWVEEMANKGYQLADIMLRTYGKKSANRGDKRWSLNSFYDSLAVDTDIVEKLLGNVWVQELLTQLKKQGYDYVPGEPGGTAIWARRTSSHYTLTSLFHNHGLTSRLLSGRRRRWFTIRYPSSNCSSFQQEARRLTEVPDMCHGRK